MFINGYIYAIRDMYDGAVASGGETDIFPITIGCH